ncbi:hypothetical protein [Legionella sp.]|uniref:hypothetical protein n=1 Tax=Legionella sp. TaxID=459 RepID=UPI003C82FE55
MQPDNNSFPKAALDAFAETKNLRIKIESIHDEQQDDALLRRFKDKWLFLVTLFLILGAFIGLVSFVVFRPDSPQAGIAINSGMGLVMALAGYYVRGKN